jgi:hypothetical protein
MDPGAVSPNQDARAERRRQARSILAHEHGLVAVRVRPGHDVSLLNVSTGGALVETACRLLPGRVIELQLVGTDRRATVRGRVLRCGVVRVFAGSIWYRSAVEFEQPLAWPGFPASC